MASDTRPGTLGTFAGVFTPSILTILGIILFLRLSYVVGNAGLIVALIIIIAANVISVLTTFSLAAIATHLRVKAGGDYYLISRTLGLGFGGAIGIVLFAAQAISVGFYAIGFAEAVAALAQWDHPAAVRIIAGAALVALFSLAWKGADWATRFQYAIMALIVMALTAFFIGGLENWDPGNFESNLGLPSGEPSLWILFAVFFPAVTGFTQGVSMSGELREPGRSIPLGTFIAVGLSFVVYIAVAVIVAGALPGDVLAEDYSALKRTSAWPFLIDAGVFAATLSSALASFMGAPRILQSLARDRIFPILQPFARGVGPSSNPRRGIILTAVVAFSIVAIGDLNAVAAIVSMFFLVSYGLLNYATYYEARGRSPSFRPRFALYHERISLIGALACLLAMLVIDARAGVVAGGVVAGIYYYLRARGVPARWADSRRSHHLQQVREHLMAAAKEPEHARDWRPQLMVFSDDVERRVRLVRFAAWTAGGAGLITVVKVIASDRPDVIETRNQALEALEKELKTYDADAFPLVIAARGLEDGIAVAIQAAGVGPTGVNTVLVNMSTASSGYLRQFGMGRYGQNVRTALRLGCNLLILDANPEDWERLEKIPASKRRIDIWWTESASSSLMLILAHLMMRADEWDNAEIRICVAGEESGGRFQRVRDMLSTSNIDADVHAVGDFSLDNVTANSRDAAIVFLPMVVPPDAPFRVVGLSPETVLEGLPITVLVAAAEDIELTSDPDQGALADLTRATDDLSDAARSLESLSYARRRLARRLTALKKRKAEAEDDDDRQRIAEEESALRADIEETDRLRIAARKKLSDAETRLQALEEGE